MRENGYYWVKFDNEWLISYYVKPCYDGDTDNWCVEDYSLSDGDMEEIDERIITRV